MGLRISCLSDRVENGVSKMLLSDLTVLLLIAQAATIQRPVFVGDNHQVSVSRFVETAS